MSDKKTTNKNGIKPKGSIVRVVLSNLKRNAARGGVDREWLAILLEMFANGSDANATQMVCGYPVNSSAFVYADNGKGFDDRAISRMFSFDDEDPDQQRKDKHGKYATGAKLPLLWFPKGREYGVLIEVYSKHTERGCVKMEISLEYLEQMLQGKTRAWKKYFYEIQELPELHREFLGYEADHGTLIVVSGVTKVKTPKTQTVVSELAQFVSFKMRPAISVYENGKRTQIQEYVPSGEEASQTLKGKGSFSDIEAKVYVGSEEYPQLRLCTPQGVTITTLQQVASSFRGKFKRELKLLLTVSGDLYSKTFNLFRVDDSVGLKPEFFGKISDPNSPVSNFMATLKDLIDLIDKNSASMRKGAVETVIKTTLQKFCTTKSGTPSQFGALGKRPAKNKDAPEKQVVLPLSIPNKATISRDNPRIRITGGDNEAVNQIVWVVYEGDCAQIRDGFDTGRSVMFDITDEGIVKVAAVNGNDIHEIEVTVCEKTAQKLKISGPSVVNTGNTGLLYRFIGGDFLGNYKWMLVESPAGVYLEQRRADFRNEVLLCCDKDAEQGRVVLQVIETSSKKIVAQKEVTIVDLNTDNDDPVMPFGEYLFRVEVRGSMGVPAFVLPNSGDVPILLVNPEVEYMVLRAEKGAWYLLLEVLYEAAAIYLVAQGEIDSLRAAQITAAVRTEKFKQAFGL